MSTSKNTPSSTPKKFKKYGAISSRHSENVTHIASYTPELAEWVGIPAAILFNRLCYWMPRKSKKLLLKTDTEVAGELGTTPKVIKTARLKLESAGLVGSTKATAGNRYAYTYVAQYFSLAPHAKGEQPRMTKRQFQNDQKAILERPKGDSHINEYTEEYTEEYSTYSEAQSHDMRNAHLVSNFVDHWKEAAHSDNWPVQIMAGNDDHTVEYFGPSIQKRIAAELVSATSEQLINEMRTATTELIDSQEWRTDDAQPKNIAWHFEILDQFRKDGFFTDCANTGSSDCTSQTWEADQPQAKAVNHCMVDLEVLSEPHIDNQADCFVDSVTQIVDVQIEVLKPEPLNDTFTPTVEKPTFEDEAKQSVSVATETAPQEENTPKPAEVDSPTKNTLKTAEKSLTGQPNNNGLISAQGEQAARQRMRNCQKNSQIPDEIRARLEELLFTNAEKAKSRGNDNADLTQ